MSPNLLPPDDDLKVACDRVEAGLEFGRETRILGTGLTGPVGMWLIRLLSELRRRRNTTFTIEILTRNRRRTEAIFGDLLSQGWITVTEQNVLRFQLAERHPDVVIHGAAASAQESFGGMQGLQKFEGVVRGTSQLLSQLDPNRDCRIIFLSSGSVFGSSLLGSLSAIPPDWPEMPRLDPGGALGHAKRAAEAHLTFHSAAHPRHTVTICRLFTFVGPLLPLRLNYALGNFIDNAIERRPITVRSDGSSIRSYMYFGDMAGWLLRATFQDHRNEIFSIGSERAISILDLAHLVDDLLGPVGVEVTGQVAGPSAYAATDMYVPNTRRTREKLSVSEWTSLEDGIRKTSQDLRPKSAPR